VRIIPLGAPAARLAAVTALAAVACVTYRARPIDPVATGAALEARRLERVELCGCLEQVLGASITPWPPAPWRLRELTAAAFCGSPDLTRARDALAVATAALVTAGARQEPGLAVTAEYQTNAGHGLSPWTLGPTIDVPLTTAGKRDIRVARGRNLAEAARLDLMASAWTVRSRVRSALVEMQAGGALSATLRVELETRRALLDALEAQRAAGALGAPEVALARAETESVQIDLATAESGGAVARAALSAALGVPIEALAGVAIDPGLGDPPGVLPGGSDRATALQARSDVLAALARYEASQDDLRLAVAEQYPDLHLGPGFLWDQGASRWQLGLSLVLPLLNRNRGPIGEAEARRAEAAGAVEAAQAAVVAAVDAASAAQSSASAVLRGADALVAVNRTLAAVAGRALEAGAVSRVDVLLAEVALQRAGRVRVDAWRAAQQALGALEDALQRPLAGEPAPPVPLAAAAGEEVAAP
jgi:outer membrane protein, heavy metal efflux system